MMTEPCKHERADAVRVLATAVKAQVRAETALARVIVLLDGLESEGQGFVPVSAVRDALRGPS